MALNTWSAAMVVVSPRADQLAVDELGVFELDAGDLAVVGDQHRLGASQWRMVTPLVAASSCS